jgi:hypothetical protein
MYSIIYQVNMLNIKAIIYSLIEFLLLLIVFAIPIGSIILFIELFFQNTILIYLMLPGFWFTELFINPETKYEISLLFLFLFGLPYTIILFFYVQYRWKTVNRKSRTGK